VQVVHTHSEQLEETGTRAVPDETFRGGDDPSGADLIFAPSVGEVHNDTYLPEIFVGPQRGQRRRKSGAKVIYRRTGVVVGVVLVIEEVEAVVLIEHCDCHCRELVVDAHELADHADTGEKAIVLQVDGLATGRRSHND